MRNPIGVVNKPFRFVLRLSWLIVLSLALFGSTSAGYASVPLRQGTVIVVNNHLDIKQSNDGLCTLREAIIAANSDKKSGGRLGECVAGNGADTIMLDVGRYELSRTDNGKEDAASTGDLDILGDVKIIGHGFGETIIDASGIADRAFQVLSGNVEISDLTITKYGATISGDGGGIHNSGNLTLVNSTVADNQTGAAGGGIFNLGVLTLNRSTISGNRADANGGGIANASSGSVTLNNSTVSGNIAANSGGGLYNTGILILNNTTIASNAANSGGGLANSSGSGAVNFRNTIIAGNGVNDCSGPLSSLGHNLDSDGSCVNAGVNGDITDSNPHLGPLQNNGGKTQTHALLPGSPAIDAGDPDGCFGSEGQLAFDQRHQPRPIDGDANGTFRCDIGAYEVAQSSLVLLRAFPDPTDNGDPTVHGLLDGAGDTSVSSLNLKLFANPQKCDISNLGQEITYAIPSGFDKTDENGYFVVDNVSVFGQVFVTATATDPAGALVQSNCVPFSADNDGWPSAFLLELEPEGGDPNVLSALVPSDRYPNPHFIDSLSQSRWYKFKVEPDSNLSIILSGESGPDALLPVDLDMTLYSDLEAAFNAALEEIQNPEPEDLVRVGAQFAGSNYSGSNYSGSNYSGSNYSGSNYSGSNYSGSNYSGSNYSGDAFLGSNYSGSNYSSDAFLGSNYSGSNYSEDFFGGSNYSQAYSDAQERSLLVVAATPGLAPEEMNAHTWNSNGFYYVRVRGRNGAFSLEDPFRFEVRLERGGCGLIDFDNLNFPDGTNLNIAGDPKSDGDGFETIILTDEDRMNLDEVIEANGTTLRDKLNALANHHNVDGIVVNVAADTGVGEANILADTHKDCPSAKNLVAGQVKQIIDAYRAGGHPLRFIVIVGVDKVIPFFRHADNADLANESQFVPPVDDATAAQAALRKERVLSDDDYLANDHIQIANNNFPLTDPGLAIGRLVEEPVEISAVIDAFLNDTEDIDGDGIPDGVIRPQTSAVAGYDFLEDATRKIEAQFRDGTGVEPDDLITPISVNIANPKPEEVGDIWTADDLRDLLLANRHDLTFLAGHFSASSALAADYQTQMLAAEVAESDVDLRNSVILSIGCHAGYNVADDDGVRDPFGNIIPLAPPQPDWAQAFAGKGATLVASTGYQFGETETVEYNERLFVRLSQKLRSPGEPIPIGQALNLAKRAYVAEVPQLLPLHYKSLIQETLFGLPMLQVDMPNRLSETQDQSILTLDDLNDFQNGPLTPGQALDLRFYDLDFTTNLQLNTRLLTDITDTNDPRRQLPAEFLSGTDGLVVTNPQEPFLPGELFNVTVPGWVLRGVGFRGGTYEDKNNILPLTGAPTTEAVANHTSFLTEAFHPMQMFNIMHLAELIDGQARVLFTPAQHKLDPATLNDDVPKSIRRQFGQMNWRLFYSNNLQSFPDQDGQGEHIPALSAPPSIARVSAIPNENEVVVRVEAIGDPAAGIQAVWLTWTNVGATCPCTWQPRDLVQRPENSKVWEGVLPLNGINPQDIRFIPWAVNGFGRIGYAMNFGQFFTPGPDTAPTVETRLTIDSAPASGEASKTVDVSAVLEFLDVSAGQWQPLPNQAVDFRLGPGLNAQRITDDDGLVTVTLNLFSKPGDYRLVVSFAGTGTYLPSSDFANFEIEPRASELIHLVQNVTIYSGQDSGIIVRLREPGNDLEPHREQGVIIVVADESGNIVLTRGGITNLFGDVSLGPVDLPPGQYTVTAYFNDPQNNPLTILASNDYTSSNAITALTIEESPCDTAVAVLHDPDDPNGDPPKSIWEPNGAFWTVDVVDPNGQASITITGIFQDEKVANNGPDARFIQDDPDSVELRAARDGNSNGRVYHVFFTADDGQGFSCTTGEVLVPVVEHDQSTGDFVGDPSDFDEGALYDSTVPPKFAPEANDDLVSTDENSAITDNVLDNDTPGKPNDVLTVTAVNGNSSAVGQPLTLASGALLTLNGDGGYSYDPNGQFELAVTETATDTFGYTIGDNDGGADTAIVTITINGANDVPDAIDDSTTTNNNASVSGNVFENDIDVDGDTLTIMAVNGNPSVVGQPLTLASGAVVTLKGDGSYTYDPNSVFSAFPVTDSFEYTADDGNGGTDTARVTITVVATNQPPQAADDTANIDEDDPNGVLINVADNDADPDNNLVPASVAVVNDPLNGTVANNGDGTVTYTPNPDFSGTDSLTYEICDEVGACDSATVTVEVTPIPDPPVANDDQAGLSIDLSPNVIIDVVANDTDVDGDLEPASVTVVTAPRNGAADDSNGDGSITYTPNEGFLGEDTFEYQVCDSVGACDTAEVVVTVAGNHPPVAVDDAPDAAAQGSAIDIDVLANDTDEDGDLLTVIQVTQGDRGNVIVNSDGTLTYTPNSNFKGSDSFTYTISDGKGGEATATVTVTFGKN